MIRRTIIKITIIVIIVVIINNNDDNTKKKKNGKSVNGCVAILILTVAVIMMIS